MMLRRVLTFTALVFFISPAISAQTVVRGMVSDSQSNEPLAGAHIIFGTGAGTSTDENGFYSFTASRGTLSVEFKYIGYRSHTETLNISAGETMELNVMMDPEFAAH